MVSKTALLLDSQSPKRGSIGNRSHLNSHAHLPLSLLLSRFPSDIYIAEVSGTHNVCAKDIYVAQVSTIVETDKPELELRPGLDLLGPIYEK